MQKGNVMITKELIARINELSRKQRTVGLTPEEKEEQQTVRGIYLAGIRAQVKGMLDNIEVVDAKQTTVVEETSVEIEKEE